MTRASTAACAIHRHRVRRWVETPFDLEWGVGIEVAIDTAIEHQARLDVTLRPA